MSQNPFKGWAVNFPINNGAFSFSYKDQEGFRVSTFQAFGVESSISFPEIDSPLSFTVLAHFLKKIAEARGESIEKDLTSKDAVTRGRALDYQKMIEHIDQLVIPTEAELKAFRGY